MDTVAVLVIVAQKYAIEKFVDELGGVDCVQDAELVGHGSLAQGKVCKRARNESS